MNIHEYQAKRLLARYGVPVAEGGVAYTPDEAEQVARGLESSVYVLKAQIHAGGRGKGHFPDDPTGGGGVRLCRDIDELREAAKAMLGRTLVTAQTGAAGQPVKRLYVEEGADIQRELYLALLIDRASKRVTVMASTEGGVEIEEVAAETPEKIIKEWVEPGMDLMGNQARHLAFALGFESDALKGGVKLIQKLYKTFIETDASLIEINPLVETPDKEVFALDAKVTFDENALFRHEDIAELRDVSEEEPLEVEASKYGLNYIKLDGNVGCMVNGAGLAMATMDMIKLSGGEPANFLDVGGAANVETVKNGFRIILEDPNVKVILINIFGGIVRCDRVANGILQAVEDPEIKKKIEGMPLIVRLQGTNAEEGKEIIDGSDLDVISAVELREAAEEVSNAVTD